MLTAAQLLPMMASLPVTDVDASPDFKNGVGRGVIRCAFEGQRAIVVASNPKTQIGALLDLVDLHLHGDGTYKGRPVSADEVTVLFYEDPDKPEALEALRTLAASIRNGPRVRLIEVSSEGSLRRIEPGPATTFEDAVKYRYVGWLDLLMRVAEPPELVRDLISRVNISGYRAYPMLANKGSWSVRLEGLEVGRFSGASGTLNVGKPGKLGDTSAPRRAWQSVAGEHSIKVAAESSVEVAADALTRFAAKWLPALGHDGGAASKQDEHALESRILRGLVPIRSADNRPLSLLRPPPNVDAGGHDALVNWGSQFPTRWGKTSAPGGRYLDAMLRDGATPWALEIKVDGDGGVGQYYRHAVEQAVLYRQFIQTATPLKPWFDRYELVQSECRAAVVVPEFLASQAKWEIRLEAVCRSFDVDLLRVPRHFAGLHEADAA